MKKITYNTWVRNRDCERGLIEVTGYEFENGIAARKKDNNILIDYVPSGLLIKKYPSTTIKKAISEYQLDYELRNKVAFAILKLHDKDFINVKEDDR